MVMYGSVDHIKTFCFIFASPHPYEVDSCVVSEACTINADEMKFLRRRYASAWEKRVRRTG